MPAFMTADAGRGLEETRPEDVAWVGNEFLVGDADRDRDARNDRISRDIFNSEFALRLILSEIIRCHPSQDSQWSNEARLDTAIAALLGQDTKVARKSQNANPEARKRPGGRKALTDEPLLRVMARDYLRDAYGFSGKTRTITTLCHKAIAEELPGWRTLTLHQLDSMRRRLARKFAAGTARDRVMIQYTGSTEYDVRRYVDLAEKILSYLFALRLVGQRPGSPDKTGPVKSTSS
jgi:hypothetical protein